MIQEHKELLIKDLCMRLPYRVVVDYAHNAFDVHKGHYVKQGSKCILTCYLLNAFISPRQNEKWRIYQTLSLSFVKYDGGAEKKF